MSSQEIDQVKRNLSRRVMEIVFTKKDGTVRTMHCTTCPHIIPVDKAPKNTFSVNEDIQRVFDVDKEEWRSFYWNSITSTK